MVPLGYGGMGCNHRYGLGLIASDGTILSLVSTAATGSRCFGDITRDPVIPDLSWGCSFFFGGGVLSSLLEFYDDFVFEF